MMLHRVSLFLALVGMGLTVHLWVQKQRNFDQGCWGVAADARLGGSGLQGCKAPELEQAGQFLGVPAVIMGYGFYFSLAVLGFGRVLGTPDLARVCHHASEYLVVAAVPYSAYLLYVQAFVARAFCPLCLLSLVLVVSLVTTLVLWRRSGGFQPLPEAARAQEAGWASALAFGGMGALAALLLFVDQLGTKRLDQGASAQQITEMVGRSLPRYVDIRKLREIAPPTTVRPSQTIKVADWVGAETAVLGAKEGPVVVVFLDPNCPHCGLTFTGLMNLAGRYRDQARFVVLPCALWEYSMLQVQSLELARREGRYYDLWQRQFDHQRKGGLSLRELEKMFRELRLDTSDFEKRLDDELEVARAFQHKVREAGIKSTPTIFVDGRSVDVRSEEAFAKAVDEALARIAPVSVDDRSR